jgi:hypothetical protein
MRLDVNGLKRRTFMHCQLTFFRRTIRLGLASIVFAFHISSAVAADDYLSELDAEASKVNPVSLGEEGGDTAKSDAVKSAASTPEGTAGSRDQFESLLQEKYLGTYGFYKKLPERSRQEIYLEYSKGAPITEVRKKIVDRLLQR